jgi:hypothetical protein
MRILISLIAFTFIMVTLFGCSTPYTIRTKDGREYHSVAKPNLTDDRYIKFVTKEGRAVLLKQDEVSSISEE